ncbi:MAG: hypothetical protein ACE5IR_09535 [bacterium]
MIRIDTKLDKRFTQPRSALGIIKQEFQRGMIKAVGHVEGKVKEKVPVGVTETAQSGVVGKVLNPFEGRVGEQGPAVKYIEVIEKGRRPGKKFPPPDAIELWLRHTDKGKAFVQSVKAKYKIKSNVSALRQATFLKSRGIAQRGIRAVKMFEKTERRERRNIEKFFRQAAKRAERRLSD